MKIDSILVKLKYHALDKEWLRNKLSACFWREDENPADITDIEFHGVTESPKRITISYQIKIKDKYGEHNHHLLGIVVNAENFERELSLIKRRKEVQTAFGKAITIIKEANLIILGFPNDRHLYLLSEEDVNKWLQKTHRKIINDDTSNGILEIESLNLNTLRYIPGKRYTARCKATIKNPTSKTREITFIAKQLKREDQAQQLYENLHILPKVWKDNLADMDFSKLSDGDFDIPVRIPRPFAIDEEKRIVYLEDLPGQNLEDIISEINIPSIIPKVGELLANFHCACRPVRKIITFESELEIIQKAAERIVRRQPAESAYLDALIYKLEALPEPEAPLITLLHGTFRINHLFISGNQLSLLDLDSLRMGHPAYDIANFISSLYYMEAQQRIDAAQRKDIMRHFLRGYLEKTEWLIPPRVLLWYLASLLIHKQAFKYVKHLRQDRGTKTNQILHLAEEIIEIYTHEAVKMSIETMYQILP